MIEKLKEQAHLLKKAVDEFYAGDEAEALHISVIVRTLVHKTDRSTPLLELIDPNYGALQIYDKMPDLADQSKRSAEAGGFVSYHSLAFQIGGGGVRPFVDLASPTYQLVPLNSWWLRACMILPVGQFPNAVRHMIFTKRQFVLTLANKEGGAHIDTDLPKDYEALITNSPIRAVVNGTDTDTVQIARCSVAQTGTELLDCVNRSFLS